MKKKLFLLLLLGSLIFPSLILAAEVFDFGPEHIVAKPEPVSKMTWLVNSGSSSENNRYIFAVLPMEQVRVLNSKYGSYRNWATCSSAGSGEGQGSIVTAMLVTNDRAVQNKLAQVAKLALNSPVVEVTGSKLKIVEYTYNKNKVAFSAPMEYYLVNDIQITQGKYP